MTFNRWWPRLLLAAASVVLTATALEVAARLVMPNRAPVHIRDNYYVTPLPLITGVAGKPLDLKALPQGERLTEAKGPQEIRVFTMGESSVAGAPYDARMSFPAMLYDTLVANHPDHDITVINMGRPASISANVYYYLLAMRRLAPDYVVFYMGMNDVEGLPGEQCMLVEEPGRHALWRQLVERSWFLWLARVYGPQFMWQVSSPGSWYPKRDCPLPSFHAWAELLVETAVASGAKVIAATPVRSAAQDLEPPEFDPINRKDFAPKDRRYLRLLRCRLDRACDYAALLRDFIVDGPRAQYVPHNLAGPPTEKRPGDESPLGLFAPPHDMDLPYYQADVLTKAAAWKNATGSAGQTYLPFHEFLEAESPAGVLGTDHFGDWLRLLPTGYMLLARHVAATLTPMIDGSAAPAVAMAGIDDVRPYMEATYNSGIRSAFEQIRNAAFLTGLPVLEFAERHFDRDLCQTKHEGFCDEVDAGRVALGWVRQLAGLPHELPAHLAKRLANFDPTRAQVRMPTARSKRRDH